MRSTSITSGSPSSRLSDGATLASSRGWGAADGPLGSRGLVLRLSLTQNGKLNRLLLSTLPSSSLPELAQLSSFCRQHKQFEDPAYDSWKLEESLCAVQQSGHGPRARPTFASLDQWCWRGARRPSDRDSSHWICTGLAPPPPD